MKKIIAVVVAVVEILLVAFGVSVKVKEDTASGRYSGIEEKIF